MLYYASAIFWLVIALAFLLLPWVWPAAGRFTILDSDISFGWLVMVLAALNFVKGWLWRKAQRRREPSEPKAVYERPRRGAEYDPTFDFSKEDHSPGHGSA